MTSVICTNAKIVFSHLVVEPLWIFKFGGYVMLCLNATCPWLITLGWNDAIFCTIIINFVTLPCGFQGQVWYLIVSIPDLRHSSYFVRPHVQEFPYRVNDWLSLWHNDTVSLQIRGCTSLHVFNVVYWTFFLKLTYKKQIDKNIRKTRVQTFGSRSVWRFVGPNLGAKCKQRLSVDYNYMYKWKRLVLAFQKRVPSFGP